VESVTAGDYGVEVGTENFFKIFKEQEFHKYEGDSIGLAFEKFIREEIEEILTTQVPS